jgi:hypothetical protein
MEEFVSAEKYAGKTVRLLAYCRANSTNGGNVQGAAGSFTLQTPQAVQIHISFLHWWTITWHYWIHTNITQTFSAVATSTNQCLIFTSNVGTIPTNAKMILVSFGFNRASTNTTYTNNLYMHAVQLVVENP